MTGDPGGVPPADARFRTLIENSAIATNLVGLDGRFRVVNQAMCDLVGYDTDALLGMSWRDVRVPDDPDDGTQAIVDILAGKRDSHRSTHQYVHADGHLVWGDLTISCIRDAEGTVEHLIGQIIDITEQVELRAKQAEADARFRILADRLQAEMRNAAEYVESILPVDLHGPVEVSSRYLPSLDLGGDCFHYRWIDDDHLEIYLIDVSGHGIRPALLSMSVHNLIRSGSLPTPILLCPDRVLDAINNLFPMEDQGDSYSTVWYGVYQLSTRTLRYASAGHPPALTLNRDGDGVTASGLSTPASPIGMFADTVYTSRSYQVPVGAQLLLYSDGAFELPGGSAEANRFSQHDFVTLCTELAARPDWSLDELVSRLKALSPTGEFDDDCALVLLTFP